jgi:formylglycine-generating enzyme required for sulfatase activity
MSIWKTNRLPERLKLHHQRRKEHEALQRRELELEGVITDVLCHTVSRISETGGKTFTNSIGMRFVFIPGGTFIMGSPENEPCRGNDETQQQVTLKEGFYMQTTPVTQDQWVRIMKSNPSHFNNCGGDCPVERVSWNETQEFIAKLNDLEGTDKYRLPTEAEWEYCCRAGSNAAYCFGDDVSELGEYAWYHENSGRGTHPVGQKRPNAWGLYDMHGNVWERTVGYHGKGKIAVLRGGCWDFNAGFARCAYRFRGDPVCRYFDIGFRCVRTL